MSAASRSSQIMTYALLFTVDISSDLTSAYRDLTSDVCTLRFVTSNSGSMSTP